MDLIKAKEVLAGAVSETRDHSRGSFRASSTLCLVSSVVVVDGSD